MRLTKEALETSVVVRRVRVGPTPFRWEVHMAERTEPLHVSLESFASLEAAYSAGQARLEEFIPKRSVPSDVHGNHRWRARPPGLAAAA